MCLLKLSGRSSLLLHLFVLLKPSPDWPRPTRTGEGHLFYSVCRFSVNLIQNHPHRHT